MIDIEVDARMQREIEKALKQIPKKLERSIVRKATRNANKKVILPKAKEAVPVETGDYEESLKVRSIKRTRTGVGTQVITKDGGMFEGDTYYGGFLEWGWRTGRRGSANRRKVEGGEYLRQTALRYGPTAINMALKEIGEAIEKEWEK